MRKYLLISFMMMCSLQCFAGSVTTVRLNTDIDLAVTGTTTSTFPINSVEPSGDGTSDTAPARVYVPMDGPSAQPNYFLTQGVTALFDIAHDYTINFPLYINATADTFYLYAAIKDPSGVYKIASYSQNTFNSSTNVNETFSVSTKLLCVQTADCTNFATVTGTEKTYMTYFFLTNVAPGTLPLGTTITPSTYPTGMYFEVNMSNRIYTSAQVSPTIIQVRPGDKRLMVEYTSNASILKPKSVRIYNYGSTDPGTTGDSQPIQTAYGLGGGVVGTEYAFNSAGEVTVTDLVNSQESNLAVFFVDLYNFTSVVSPHFSGTPLEIQELLKKNSCFLLTAGFGEDHYVINYFRHFRDTVLVNSFLGRKFIHFYYGTAPKYALMIYQHETIRAVIRGAAYVLYFIFNYIYLIAFVIFAGGAALCLNLRRAKS